MYSVRLRVEMEQSFAILRWLTSHNIRARLGIPHGLDFIYDYSFDSVDDYMLFLLTWGEFCAE